MADTKAQKMATEIDSMNKELHKMKTAGVETEVLEEEALEEVAGGVAKEDFDIAPCGCFGCFGHFD